MMQRKIILKLKRIENKIHFQLQFEYHKETIEICKTLRCCYWNYRERSWFVPYTKNGITKIKEKFKEYTIENLQIVEDYLDKYSYLVELSGNYSLLNKDTQQAVLHFKDWMVAQRFSESTIRSYLSSIIIFLNFFSDKDFRQLTNNDWLKFNTEYIIKKNLSRALQNQVLNAIKHFFRKEMGYLLNIEELERPRKQVQLPNILSIEEVQAILNACKNIKHRTMLCLIYSNGLRRSEILNLTILDIDSNRMELHIRKAKGNKDRVLPLAEKMLEMLREYYKEYKPKKYLFEGQDGGRYSEKSIAQVFTNAKMKARVKKKASLHTLRHSFATHVLESGTSLRYIQDLLGHRSSKTTEIYTHVSKVKLQSIHNPLNDIKLS